ncbi:hypothetical protein DUNSADRAFT_12455 [Dunaliella salina]|uniref:Encoded protein n=1 Tax=Dunaliella salina TaxID=3046 RepID=A0ABQ7H3T8_DUNSA|nr:hypothetical protein DUNSADRAFT_12455 [Dunaliella salina]|eukprot:KAF5841527.1 hypothetical protein DUNSADRAFT_12455 [Dunaliella salina]
MALAVHLPSSPLPFASRTRRKHASVCHVKPSNSGSSWSLGKPERVDPDLIIPPPPQGSQYQRPESSFAYGGDGGGGKGGGFYNLFTGGGSFGEGDEGGQGRRRPGADFAPFNRVRLMLLSIGWALSVYLVISSLFRLLRAAVVKSGVASWLQAANPMTQVQFQDDNRRSEERTSEQEGDGEEYEAMQAGGAGAVATACAATPGVQSQAVGEGIKGGRDSSDVSSVQSQAVGEGVEGGRDSSDVSSVQSQAVGEGVEGESASSDVSSSWGNLGVGEGCAGGVSEQRDATNSEQRDGTNGQDPLNRQEGGSHSAACSQQSGDESGSGATAAAEASSQPGTEHHALQDENAGGHALRDENADAAGGSQIPEVNEKGASTDGALSSEQLAHADLLRQYKQRREANAAASITGGRFSTESSLTWHTTCAYCMVLGTLAFFFNIK